MEGNVKQARIERKLEIIDSHEMTDQEKIKLLLKLKKYSLKNVKRFKRKSAVLEWLNSGYDGPDNFIKLFTPLSFVPVVAAAIACAATGVPGWVVGIGGVVTFISLAAVVPTVVNYEKEDKGTLLEILDDKAWDAVYNAEDTIKSIDAKLVELGYVEEKTDNTSEPLQQVEGELTV